MPLSTTHTPRAEQSTPLKAWIKPELVNLDETDQDGKVPIGGETTPGVLAYGPS